MFKARSRASNLLTYKHVHASVCTARHRGYLESDPCREKWLVILVDQTQRLQQLGKRSLVMRCRNERSKGRGGSGAHLRAVSSSRQTLPEQGSGCWYLCSQATTCRGVEAPSPLYLPYNLCRSAPRPPRSGPVSSATRKLCAW